MNLKRIREEKGLTQKELGIKLGVSKQTIYKYEKGMKVPSLKRIKQLVDILKCSYDELLGR